MITCYAASLEWVYKRIIEFGLKKGRLKQGPTTKSAKRVIFAVINTYFVCFADYVTKILLLLFIGTNSFSNVSSNAST